MIIPPPPRISSFQVCILFIIWCFMIIVSLILNLRHWWFLCVGECGKETMSQYSYVHDMYETIGGRQVFPNFKMWHYTPKYSTIWRTSCMLNLPVGKIPRIFLMSLQHCIHMMMERVDNAFWWIFPIFLVSLWPIIWLIINFFLL